MNKKLSIIVVSLLSMQGLLFSESVKFYGEATDLKTGKKLYYDHHEEFYKNEKHIYSNVEYKDITGKVFAKKKISFQKSATLADFKLEDFRDGYVEGAEVSGNQIKFLYKKNQNETLKEVKIAAPFNAVIDGGFDYFVLENWDNILVGKKSILNLCAPSQQDCFKFVVFKTGESKRKGSDVVSMKVELNNPILSAFVKPILLVYSKERRKLLQYDGMSNINDEEGKSYLVRITYDNFI